MMHKEAIPVLEANKEKGMKKQGVELYRFIMTIIICLHHFRLYSETTLPYGGGYLAVDFFFILSGFFLYERSVKEITDNTTKAMSETAKYAICRYKRLYPEYVIVLLLSVLVYVYVLHVDANIIHIGSFLAKLFMVDGIFVHMQLSILPQGWYCSVLWIGSVVVYFLSIRYGQRFTKRVALFFSVGIYVFLFLRYGYLNLYTQYGFGVTIGGFRGIAGLCLGCVLGNVVDSGNKMRIKSRWMNVVLFTFFTCTVLYALLWDTAYKKSDFVVLFVFVGILYYLLSDNDISKFLNRYKLSGIGSISYAMFLVHHLIAVMFEHYNWLRDYDWKIASIAYLGVVVSCSFLIEGLMMIVKSAINKWSGSSC